MSVHPVFVPILEEICPSNPEEIRKENDYANAMIKRDKETPQWLRELLTGDPR